MGRSPQITHTHLQESVDLLFFLPVHISFLKELEVRDKAPTWSDIPVRNVLGGSKGATHGSDIKRKD